MTTTRPSHPTRPLTALAAALVLAAVTLLAQAPAGALVDGPWSTNSTVTAANQTDGLVVHVEGSGFTGLPSASTGAPAAGIYVALKEASTTVQEINDDNAKAMGVVYLPPPLIGGGSFSTDVVVPAEKPPLSTDDVSYQVITWVAHGNITDDTQLTQEDIELSDEQMMELIPGWTPPATTPPPSDPNVIDPGQTTTTPDTTTPDTTTPGSTAPPSTSPGTAPPATTAPATTLAPGTTPPPTQVPGGTGPYCVTETVAGTLGTPQMTWGIKSSFTNYIESNIAKGTIETSGGVVRSGSDFIWPNGSGEVDASNNGTWSFGGSVHFSGHDGVLNLNLSNLRVQVNGGTSGTLIADIDSTDMEGNDVGGDGIAMADLAFESLSTSGGTAAVTLTSAGASAFASFYEAGESLDPLTVQVAGSGSQTVETCYDAEGNVIGSPRSGGSLAATGFGGIGLVGPGLALIALGALAVIVAARRRSGPAAA